MHNPYLSAKKLYSILLSLLLIQFVDGQTRVTTGSADLSTAKWIAGQKPVSLPDSLLYLDHPAPLFKKDFVLQEGVREARLTIAAAGYFRVRVNGMAMEDNLLEPAWTNFSKRIYSSTFDVTHLLRKGNNRIAVELGNGFYNLLPLRMWGSRNLREPLPTGEPRFIAALEMITGKGEENRMLTDESWLTAPGPLLRNSVYLGVSYDASLNPEGWDQPEAASGQWEPAKLVESPGGILQPGDFPAIGITEKIRPVSITCKEKRCIVDFGQNVTGTLGIRLHGKPGGKVVFRYGERLFQDGTLNPMTTVAGQIKKKGRGGPGSPDIAWQEDQFRFGRDERAYFQPNFTFHTFRYLEITGLDYTPAADEMEALVFHSKVENGNYFRCSEQLINEIQTVCRRTFLNNLQSVQSDCPAREKFGYGGDLNATADAFCYNFDMHGFYKKTIYDWVDAMQDSIFIDTAPFVGIKYCGISWESAFLITQDKLLQYYGDTGLVKKLYPKDLEWMQKVKKLHPEGLVHKGLSDHESMVKVPVELIGSCHYLECAEVMQRFATICGDKRHALQFSELANRLRGLVREKFWDQPVPDPINRQTLFATLLVHGIVPKHGIPAAIDSLRSALNHEPAGHFTTGIFGTKYILEALSRAGLADEVYRIVKDSRYPGWGHMVDRGATTLWETWKESEDTYSNCHPMFGSVSEWFFRWLAGIRPMEAGDGFRKFWVDPCFPEKLQGVQAQVEASGGKIVVKWERGKDGHLLLDLTVPSGSIAVVPAMVPGGATWKVTMASDGKRLDHPMKQRAWELPAGTYRLQQ
ncbi:MAG: glycoside hydrolase family 78 protein [Marinilabiliales bacterium]|nr:glycoside hydrolase family 78 protein [Marinilabiliales bacterium]